MKSLSIFKSFLSLLAVSAVVLFTSGAGYVGELPKFNNDSKIIENAQGGAKIQDEPIIPMAKKVTPSIYTGVIVNRGKYSQYLKELDEIIPVLESTKQIIEDKNSDIQMFCAKANMIHLYVTCLNDKYGKRTERYYESFKQLGILNKNLTETADYWRYTYKYNKLLRGSLKAKQADERLMSQKLSTALKSINTTLEILKENTSEN